jgi:hypothetical protein
MFLQRSVDTSGTTQLMVECQSLVERGIVAGSILRVVETGALCKLLDVIVTGGSSHRLILVSLGKFELGVLVVEFDQIHQITNT